MVGFARLDGRAIGIVANQPKVKGGVLFVDSADKAARFIWTCNAFNVPLLFLADVPGFMIGTQVERQGIIRHGAKMISAVSEATVPKISVIVRKAYGAGLYAMAGPAFEPDCCIALPTASIAVMGPEAAINAVFYNQIQEIDDPAEREEFVRRKRDEYAADIDILHLASELVVDAVIEPDDLRAELIRRFALAETKDRALLAAPQPGHPGLDTQRTSAALNQDRYAPVPLPCQGCVPAARLPLLAAAACVVAFWVRCSPAPTRSAPIGAPGRDRAPRADGRCEGPCADPARVTWSPTSPTRCRCWSCSPRCSPGDGRWAADARRSPRSALVAGANLTARDPQGGARAPSRPARSSERDQLGAEAFPSGHATAAMSIALAAVLVAPARRAGRGRRRGCGLRDRGRDLGPRARLALPQRRRWAGCWSPPASSSCAVAAVRERCRSAAQAPWLRSGGWPLSPAAR